MSKPLYRRVADVLHSPVGDDVVALSVHHGLCFGMEEVTAQVWRLLADPRDLDELCAALVETYDVSEVECRDQVGALLTEMTAAGLIERV